MKKYVSGYYNYFGLLPEADTLWDEYEYIYNNKLVVAENIHHIDHGANKWEGIENWMALSFKNHDDVHQEKLLDRETLKDIHLQFLKYNPYD